MRPKAPVDGAGTDRPESVNVANDLLPAIGTGALLLLVGAAFLGLGAVVFAGSPEALSVWVLLLGGLVLASGLVTVGLSRRRRAVAVAPKAAAPVPSPRVPAPVPAPAAPPPVAPGPSAPSASRGALAAPRAVERAAAVGPAPGAPRSVSTSIPGAYLQSINPGLDLSPWPEAPPPVVAALPFSAGVPRTGPDEPAPERPAGSEAVLELELARLRARVRELETPRPRPGPVPAGTSVARSGAVATFPRPSGEPPAPSTRPSVGGRGCAGCGHGLPVGRAPLLCWGCGQALCASCFWRYGPGPGLHRCPDCLSKASGSGSAGPGSISGGRSGLSPSAGAPPTSGPGPSPDGR